ncbi:MAG: bifunctional folylpolyglutamate synthase/dihydrofolate synthase [Ignavibacteriales bacterium]|nr:bifunctional folylpolyglutamate synthase/dihydrofolate synthase [Ignavibacteriales bacterium]
MDYSNLLQKLYQKKQSEIKLGLDRVQSFLDILGNPDKTLKAFHIAGSNGKGSVSAFISSILSEAGFKVGLYTSPHFIKFNERIKVGKEMICDEYIAKFLSKHLNYIDEKGLTFFEITTALAFEYFANSDIDFVVIETGLGGRLDATNTINPLASIITTISLEHTNILGKTYGEIAGEKAGIFKNGIPVFYGLMNKSAEKRIRYEAIRKNTSDIFNLKDFIIDNEDNIVVNFDKLSLNLFTSPLKGKHQFYNAALACLSVYKTLDIYFPEIYLNGIQNVVNNTGIEGRFEILNKNPVIILDSAHNPDGINTFLNTFKEFHFKGRIILLISALKDKNFGLMLKKFNEVFKEIYFFELNNERALAYLEAEAFANSMGIEIKQVLVPGDFINNYLVEEKSSILAVTGSMYLVGIIKEYLSIKNQIN